MVLSSNFHFPVLLSKVLDGLEVRGGGKYIDATLGGGGYAREIIKRGGKVLGIDRDEEALLNAKSLDLGKKLVIAKGNFAEIGKIAKVNGFEAVEGIVFDLGMSTNQLQKSGRGFSYLTDEPLDMRMDQKSEITAADIVNSYSEEKLYEIFTKFSEELHSRTIAAAIVRARSLKKGQIGTTGELVEAIDTVMQKIYKDQKPMDYKRKLLPTLSRIFQALRIEVNDELTSLKLAIGQSISLLRDGGRLLIVSYHSLEDRTVKLAFRSLEKEGLIKILNKQPVTADYIEIKANPKSRSAKLRMAQRQIQI